MRIELRRIVVSLTVLTAAPMFARAGIAGSATVVPSTIQEGGTVTSTLTYTVPASGLSIGGRIQIGLPTSWGPFPQTNSPASFGYVSYSSTATATLTFVTSSTAPVITATVTGAVIPAGTAIQFFFQSFFVNCPTSAGTGGGGAAVWTVQTAATTSDAFTSTSGVAQTYITGAARWLNFVPWNPITVVANQPSQGLVLQVGDSCGLPVTSTSPIIVTLRGGGVNGTGTDSLAVFSSTATMAPTSSTITIPASTLSTIFYYKTGTTGSNLAIQANYNSPFDGSLQAAWRQVTASLSSAFTFNNLSVDGGTAASGQTTMTISPDNSGANNLAYIRFQPSDNATQWHVTISSDNFSTIVFERWGNGNPLSTLVWDGHNSFNGYTVVPNGTYTVKVEAVGLLTDTSLRVLVAAAQVTGTVKVDGVAVGGAQISAQGSDTPGFSQTVSAANGSYVLSGLRPGGYHYNLTAVYISTAGAATQTLNNVAVPSSQNFNLTTPITVRIAATLPSTATASLYGQINVHSSDYQQNYFGNIHFAAGSAASDNGDFFNPSTWTVLYLSPTIPSGGYTLHLTLQGYGAADITGIATSADLVLNPTPQAVVSGLIVLPSTVTTPTWISVQGTLQGRNSPSVWGGLSLNVGESTGTYMIPAVSPGTYSFSANPTGYVPLVSTGVVVGTTSLTNVNFISFSQGKSIQGTLTINGDSSELNSPVTAWVNAFSPSSGQSSFAQVQLTTSSVLTSASYVISGLANGTYQVSPPFLDGFEGNPQGPQTIVVNGANATLNLTLQRQTGQINVTVQLPGGASDFSNVHLSLQGPTGKELNMTASSQSFQHLAGGYYTLTGTYLTSGAQKQINTSVTEGSPVNLTLDLRATTYSVTGTVSVQSGFSMQNSTGTVVTVNTITDLLAAATTQVLTMGTIQFNGPTAMQCVGTSITTSTARVEAFPKTFNSFNNSNNFSLPNCFGVGQYRYGVIDSNGNYSISGLSDGVWEINVYPYFDNGSIPNVATSKQFVTISGGNATANFALAAGYAVSGTISLPTGVTDTINLSVQVQDTQGNLIQSGTINSGSPVASMSYSISNLPSGNYSLVLRDQSTAGANNGQIVAKYVAKPVQFTISGGNLAGVNVTMASASHIVGRLGIQGTDANGAPTLTLITPNNLNLLASNFFINAQANPWVPGGFQSANFDNGGRVSIDANNQFEIDGLLAGIYDVRFMQNSYGASIQGQGSLNLASYTQGSVTVPEGQTVDLGTIALVPGITLFGRVTDASNQPFSNIVVRAQPSNSQHGSDGNQTFTDANGNYTLAGLNPSFKQYDIVAAPRPSPGDNTALVPYGQVSRLAFDVTQSPLPNVNFSLPSATGQLTGKVVTSDGGPLSYTDGDQKGYPVAAIYLKAQGDRNEDNPLGFASATDLNGNFTISNLVPGIYDLTAESFGYGPVKLAAITVTSASQNLPTITLQRGPSLQVNLAHADGTPVNTSEVDTVVAATADLGYILFGQVTSDANTSNIVSIKFAGFQLAPQTYSIVLIDKQGNLYSPADGTGIQFSSATDQAVRNITFTPGKPQAFTHVRKEGSAIVITYYLTRPLRNQANDQDPSQWLSVVSGLGTLSGYAISGDRRQLTVTYTPAGGEQNATIAFNAHTIDIDPSTGTQFTVGKTITLLLGQKATAEQIINPSLGGTISLSDNNDPSGVTIPSNGVRNNDGSAVTISSSYTITFTATDDASSVPTSAPGLFHAPGLNGMLAWGSKAFNSEAYAAMTAARAQSFNPLSSFYTVLLPAGLSHSLTQTAFLTLNYNTSADPTQINVYYYDGTKYIIQQDQRTIDTVNHTIRVAVNHFSTFVVLQNNSPVILVSGSAASGPALQIVNFPNPFDLKPKTLPLNHGGATTSLSTDGTILRYVIPSSMAGPATIDIYDIVGEKVRGLNLGAPTADTYNYVTWDGRNDHGNQVASGVYIGVLKVGGNKAFLKMAVIK